jgi:hypothetical protein
LGDFEFPKNKNAAPASTITAKEEMMIFFFMCASKGFGKPEGGET